MTSLRIARAITAALFVCVVLPRGGSAQLNQNGPDPAALFALEKKAVDGAALANAGTVHLAGTITQGGAPGTFDETIDRRTGHSSTTTVTGPMRETQGFDGTGFDAHGGIVGTIDVPGLVADLITQAYVDRDGWWNADDPATTDDAGERKDGALTADAVRVVPQGGSAVEVWFDRKTHRIDRTILDGELGRVVTNYSDYRAFGPVIAPAAAVTIDPTGATTKTVVQTITLRADRPGAAIARPAPRSHASISGVPPVSVPFQFDGIDGGHIVMNVAFDGKTVPVDFDSGGVSVLLGPAASAAGLRTWGGVDATGVGNGSIRSSFAHLDSIAAGGAELHDQTALILPPFSYVFAHPRAGIDVEGLAGAELLYNFRTTVDYAARTITFAPFDTKPPTGGAQPIFSDGQDAYVTATIDGVRGIFMIDTGDAGGLTVFRKFADAHGLYQTPGIKYTAGGGIGGRVVERRYRGKTLEIGGLSLHAPVVSVSEAAAGAFAARTIAGNVGADVLKRFTLTFDYAARTLSFVPNAQAGAPFAADRCGISFNQHEPSAVDVVDVAPDSPAAKAALAPGDEILAINGQTVAAARLGLGDLRPIFWTGSAPVQLHVRRGEHEFDVTILPRDLLPKTVGGEAAVGPERSAKGAQ